LSNFVLVPGAWLGAWVWKKVIRPLESKGNEVYPITLTGMGERSHLISKDVGIETAIQDVLNVIKYNDLDDVILVGHSFAGKVVAPVGDRIPEKVRSILYLDATRPERIRTPQGSFDPAAEFGKPPSGSLGIQFNENILNNIGPDVQGPERDWMLTKATPWPLRHSTDPIVLSKNFDSIKSNYIFCSRTGDPVDEIIEGKWGELYGPYWVMDTGHWPMVTRPEELAKNMIALAGK